MKQRQGKDKRVTSSISLKHEKKKAKGHKPKKTKFHELMLRQKQLKIKLEKNKEIEEKRKKRLHQRKERNVSMQKLTSKGQPVMRHRIKLLLKQMCPENA
uniref:Uncharacterized protein n=1 Tax=Schistosoma japonicum TaxID=6182 RepID=C1LGA3_SCHJA|nr:hypothetical protein [Schistosoma japonicum]